MVKMTKKFRASYSVLSAWASGNYETAVKMYFKMDTYTSPQMAEGKEWHNRWETYIKRCKRLPLELGNDPLVDPKTELKLVVDIADWLELVGRIDCFDNGTVYEFKTGATPGNSNSYEIQAGVYGVISLLSGYKPTQCQIRHYNQHKKVSSCSIYWVTEKRLKDALAWVEGNASEMHDYLTTNDLYAKLGGQDYAAAANTAG